MAFVGTDIQAALGASWPELTYQLDGTLDLGDAAVLFGTGAEITSSGGGGGGSGGSLDLVLSRRIVRR